MSLKGWPEIRVEVGGHTDSAGGDGYNLRLSQDRAQAVLDYLVENGVERTRLSAKGFGEGQPLADNATDGGRRQNRRVELKRLD
jgi:OOP family OmpA-OmpF porin